MDLSLGVTLLYAPICFFLHNGIHEGSHALAIEATGGHVQSLTLYPHYEAGSFVWASTMSDQSKMSNEAKAFNSIAPLIAEVLIFATAQFLLHYIDMPDWMRAIVRVEAIASAVDIAVWTSGAITGAESSDAMRFARRAGIDKGLVTAAFVSVPLLTLGF